MATKIYCDGCGKELDMRGRKYVHIYITNHDDQKEDYDLCAECYESIRKRLNTVEETDT